MIRMNSSERATVQKVFRNGKLFVRLTKGDESFGLFYVMESRGYSTGYLQKKFYYLAALNAYGFVDIEKRTNGVSERNPDDVLKFWEETPGINVEIINQLEFDAMEEKLKAALAKATDLRITIVEAWTGSDGALEILLGDLLKQTSEVEQRLSRLTKSYKNETT